MAARPLYFPVFILLLVFLDLTLRVAFGLGARSPDLMTVAALVAARRMRSAHAAGLGFLLGMVNDGAALTDFGASAFALAVVAYLGARSRDLFEGESLLFVLVYLFLGKWLRDALGLLAAPGTLQHELVPTLLVSMPAQAGYAALAGVLALVIYRAVGGERA